MTTKDAFDPTTLTFREATTEEKIKCWQTNSQSWAGKLSKEDYVQRESINGSGTLGSGGGIRYWVFVNEENEIYASVETLRKRVAIQNSDGVMSLENTYGIASVYTVPEHRGKKVAACMMQRLAAWLDGEAGVRFSVLYSDIGVRMKLQISFEPY
jgi:hypothetical protein